MLVLSNDALHFTKLAGFYSSLDVLEYNFLILAKVDNGAKEIEEALKALERLEQVAESKWSQLLVVLCCNLQWSMINIVTR